MQADVTEPTSRHLRMVDAEQSNCDEPDAVRATRRTVARFLRALHASGHAIAGWPPALVSRLAHADAVTARFLSQPERVDAEEAAQAAAALEAVMKAIVAGLNHHERARLRSYELTIRVDPAELVAPLVQPDRAPEEHGSSDSDVAPRPASLRTGLAALADDQLHAIARRLGMGRKLRALALNDADADAAAAADGRDQLVREVASVLRDDHLLGILIATLQRDALELLGGLVRGSLDDVQILAAQEESTLARAVGDHSRTAAPASALEQCGLAFRSQTRGRRMWVPAELCRRLDGLLLALGV